MLAKINFSIRYYKGNNIAGVMQFNEILDLCSYTAEYSPGLGRLYQEAKRNKLNDKFLFAVARSKKEPIAVACVHGYENRASFAQVYVRPNCRRKGVATRLVKNLLVKSGLDKDSLVFYFGKEGYMREVLLKAGYENIEEGFL